MSDGDVDEGPDATATVESDPGLAPLLETLRDRYNFDFREYKEPSLVRRIRGRMAQVHAATFAAYAQYLDEHADEHVALFNAILINVTGFFRDAEAWAALRDDVVPQLVADAREARSLRIWSAGCSTGEEAYSLALLIAEHLGDHAANIEVKIYGTDVDEEALATARQGLYRPEEVRVVPARLLDRAFVREGQFYRVRRDLRRWCIFGAHNLAQAAPLSHLDLLACRNVLIYFNGALQERILSRFHYALRPDGYLFLGRSESLLARSRLFAPLHAKWRIFRRLPTGGGARTAPVPALRDSFVPDADTRERSALAAPVLRALAVMPAAVIVVDAGDTVVVWNEAAELLFDIPAANAVGHRFRELDVSYRIEGLRARLEEVKARQTPARVEDATFTRRAGQVVHAAMTLSPLFDNGRFIGVLIYTADASEHVRLRDQMARVAEQHATAIEELQSTNEELETTNEELQSTNEELETTNEELQSTNEELETTVEELQAANAELAALNEELEQRGGELARLDTYHRGVANTVDHGLIVLDRDGVVRTWNHAAERALGLTGEQTLGRALLTLPLGESLREFREAAERVLQNGQPESLGAIAVPGRPTAVRLDMSAVTDANGAVVGALVAVRPAA